MGTVNIPTTWEIYQIAFLTQRGWTLDRYTGGWTKQGRTHTIVDLDGREVESNVFDLDEAYWTEVE